MDRLLIRTATAGQAGTGNPADRSATTHRPRRSGKRLSGSRRVTDTNTDRPHSTGPVILTAIIEHCTGGSIEHRRRVVVSRYDTRHVDIYRSARKHGVADADILHAVDHALGAAEQDDGKVLYLGADRAGNMLEVIAIERDDGTEIVIHAMRMRRLYEPLLREMRGTND